MKNLLYFMLLIFTLSLPIVVMADDMTEIEQMANQLNKINKKISRGHFEDTDLAEWTRQTIKLQSASALCVANNEAALLDLKTQAEGLGEKVAGEDSDVTKKRENYQKQKDQLDKVLAKCNLFILSGKEISQTIKKAEKSYFRQKYLARSPNIIVLAKTYLENPVAIFAGSSDFLVSHSGINEIDTADIGFSVIAIIIAVLLGLRLRSWLLLIEGKRQWQQGFSQKLIRALLTTFSRASPYLTGSAVATLAALLVTAEAVDHPFVTEFCLGLLVFYLSTIFIRLFFAPDQPAQLILPLTPGIAERLAKRFRVLAVLGLVGYLAFYTVFSQSIPEDNLLLMRNIYSLFFVVNLVWTLQVIIASPKLPKLRYIAMLVIVAVSLTLIVEWMGYRNLAFSGRRTILFTFMTFVMFIGVSKMFGDLFNAIDNATCPLCKRVHKFLGVADTVKIPGMIWIRLLTTFAVWGVFAYIFIGIWDYSGSFIEHLKGYLVNGFELGDTRIVPGRILLSFLIFGLIIIFSSWVRTQLENNWLKMTTMGQGARDALVTITGYIMFFIAIMSGLSTAGFDFSNIAIIAGALSVGIGFGLQNIVNNFVSGLILLFERPIRKGDWIVVGGTEGYVKDIQIRSTRIQTFDRSDVIVPNSELISNQVTNWVLSGNSGRVSVPIGVAYGSDTEKVRDILLAIAEENEDVCKTELLPKPKVLFREFGDSSLNFELRVFLHNIDSRYSIISDINFAIDKAFRKEGIEIPFPQRDVHVKTLTDARDGASDDAKADKAS